VLEAKALENQNIDFQVQTIRTFPSKMLALAEKLLYYNHCQYR
jgi:hypothetical protein